MKIQAHVRAGLAKQHAERLRQQQSAVAAMEVAMTSGSRVKVQAAAAQLVQAGVLESYCAHLLHSLHSRIPSSAKTFSSVAVV